MTEDQTALDAAGIDSRDDWFARIDEIGEELGYFERIGAHHSAFFVDDKLTTLLVTFETVAAIRGGSDHQMPYGFEIARARNWSHLCIIAEGDTWFRDNTLFRYFDRLVDDAFFEDFDQVVFYGAGMSGYAAAAYSVVAPGATVLLIQPVATLDPAVTGWDDRFRKFRRLDFTRRYGYGPDMTEGAGKVFVIFDPHETADAMQAALFTKSFTTMLPCAALGSQIEPTLARMTLLPRLLDLAGNGTLSARTFWKLYRERRNYAPFLRSLLGYLESRKRPMLAGLLCRNVLGRMRAPLFRRKLIEMQEAGLVLPPRHGEGPGAPAGAT